MLYNHNINRVIDRNLIIIEDLIILRNIVKDVFDERKEKKKKVVETKKNSDLFNLPAS